VSESPEEGVSTEAKDALKQFTEKLISAVVSTSSYMTIGPVTGLAISPFLPQTTLVHDLGIFQTDQPFGIIVSDIGKGEHTTVKTITLREARELALRSLRRSEERRLQSFEEEARFFNALDNDEE